MKHLGQVKTGDWALKTLTVENFKHHLLTDGDFRPYGQYTVSGPVEFPFDEQNLNIPHDVYLGEGIIPTLRLESVFFNKRLDLGKTVFLNEVDWATCEIHHELTGEAPKFLSNFIVIACKIKSMQFKNLKCDGHFNIGLVF